jgi:hypothetical protein
MGPLVIRYLICLVGSWLDEGNCVKESDEMSHIH